MRILENPVETKQTKKGQNENIGESAGDKTDKNETFGDKCDKNWRQNGKKRAKMSHLETSLIKWRILNFPKSMISMTFSLLAVVSSAGYLVII
jgi:hypothetical protein